MRTYFAIAVLLSLSAVELAAQSTTSIFAPNTPESLPGDRLPAPGLLPKPRPPGPPGEKPAPYVEPSSTVASPTLEQAETIAKAAVAACLRDGFRVGAAVIDSAGAPRALLSADGALGGHAYTGARKGLAAIAFEAPTSTIATQIAADSAKKKLLTPAMMPFPGAVPLKLKGRLIGAVGVSGAASLQDEKCALSAARRAGL